MILNSFLHVFEAVLLCSSSWPGIHFVTQAGLELLPQLSEGWNYSDTPPHLLSFMFLCASYK
jgi:hypothetical protein